MRALTCGDTMTCGSQRWSSESARSQGVTAIVQFAWDTTVSSLLMQIDDLPSHVVVVTATNHPELLDRAVWRRFQLRLELPHPTPKEIEDYFATVGSR